MPDRTFYRDPSTGRFVGRDAAADLDVVVVTTISGGQRVDRVLSSGELIEDQGAEQDFEPYYVEPSRWGGRFVDGDELDPDRLEATPFPGGYDAFRVTYKVGAGGRYTKGFASSEWMSPDMWPPDLDLLEGVEPEGIGHVVFRRSQ